MAETGVDAADVSEFFQRKELPKAPPRFTRKDNPATKKLLKARRRRTGLSHQHGPQNTNEVQRTVFVGNLPNTVDASAVSKFVSKCGEVESVRLRSIRLQAVSNGKDRGRAVRVLRGERLKDDKASCNAFVLFKEVAGAQRACRELPGSVFKGRHLSVTLETPAAKAFEPRTSLFLGNLSPDVSDEDVWSFFLSQGVDQLNRVRVVRDATTGKAKGIAYVGFSEESAISPAIQLRGGDLAGRAVRICHVMKSKDPNIQKVTRRQKRAQQQDEAGGPQPQDRNKFKNLKTSQKRGIEATTAAPAPWMGTTTNPRKKLAKDLRSLTTNDAERRRAMRKQRQGGGGAGPKKPGPKKSAPAGPGKGKKRSA